MMNSIEKLVRPNILKLQPYSSARSEFKGAAEIFLDANENPFGDLNRYPDPMQMELKQALSKQKKIAVENIFVGNGSDEVIDLALRIFCNPGTDKIITCPPTYGMYEVSANINAVEILKINLTEDFQLDLSEILKSKAKMIFVCSPNNPTGNSMQQIEELLQKFEGIVFVDEAYIEFSEQESMLGKIAQYPNLIVSQTFSKAWGLAAARVGIAYASEEIISLFNKIKTPYNVSRLNQQAALRALQNPQEMLKQKSLLLSEKKKLEQELEKLDFVEKIYASDANFLLVKMKDAEQVYNILVNEKIITRNRTSEIENCIRISIGTPIENAQLVQQLKQINL